MENREIYWGQDAALFADAWLDNLWSALNIVNIGKASVQGMIGWRMGLYSTLTLALATEIAVDVLLLTTGYTLIDPTDKHNWGIDDLASGVVEATPHMDWSKMTFGSVV